MPGYDFALSDRHLVAVALSNGLPVSRSNYPEAVANLVFEGLAHGAPSELRPQHSWALYALSLVRSPTLMYTQDPNRIVESGSAICSQSARVVVAIAERDGVPARIVGLPGHVVAEIFVEDRWHLVDADYGLTLPASVSEIREAKWHGQVRNALTGRGYNHRQVRAYIDVLKRASVLTYRPLWAPDEPKPWLIERSAVLVSWGIPVLLIGGGAALLWMSLAPKSRAEQALKASDVSISG